VPPDEPLTQTSLAANSVSHAFCHFWDVFWTDLGKDAKTRIKNEFKLKFNVHSFESISTFVFVQSFLSVPQ
jgi:hypothetical protein